MDTTTLLQHPSRQVSICECCCEYQHKLSAKHGPDVAKGVQQLVKTRLTLCTIRAHRRLIEKRFCQGKILQKAWTSLDMADRRVASALDTMTALCETHFYACPEHYRSYRAPGTETSNDQIAAAAPTQRPRPKRCPGPHFEEARDLEKLKEQVGLVANCWFPAGTTLEDLLYGALQEQNSRPPEWASKTLTLGDEIWWDRFARCLASFEGAFDEKSLRYPPCVVMAPPRSRAN